MTDSTGNNPFSQFSPTAGYEMFETMLKMMQLSGFPPGQSQGAQNPLSLMSDLVTPLMNLDELDKRITDMRTVEQWLKLNLNMLQSTIQALEVQRATLATMHAFSAFAQQSMTTPTKTPGAPTSSSFSSSFPSSFGTSSSVPFGAFGPFSATGSLGASPQGRQPVEQGSPDEGAQAESAGAEARAAVWPLNPFAFAMGNMASRPVSEPDRETDKQAEPHESTSPSTDAIPAQSGAIAAPDAQVQGASPSGTRGADQAADEAPSAIHPSASGVFGAPSGTSPAFGSASADARTGTQGDTAAQAGADAGAAGGAAADGTPSRETGLDPSMWWNLLQTQFNQIAGLAMASATQPDPTPNAGSEPTANAGSGKQGTQSATSAQPAVASVGRDASDALTTAAHSPATGAVKAAIRAGTRDVGKEAVKGAVEKTATQPVKKTATQPVKKTAAQSAQKQTAEQSAQKKMATPLAKKTVTQPAQKEAATQSAKKTTTRPAQKETTTQSAQKKTATQAVKKTSKQSATKPPAKNGTRQVVGNAAAPSKVRAQARARADSGALSDSGARVAERSSDASATRSSGAGVVVARSTAQAHPQASGRANRAAARQASPPLVQTEKPDAGPANAITSHTAMPHIAMPHNATAARTSGPAEATVRDAPGGGHVSSPS
jgi:hypothetical protein